MASHTGGSLTWGLNCDDLCISISSFEDPKTTLVLVQREACLCKARQHLAQSHATFLAGVSKIQNVVYCVGDSFLALQDSGCLFFEVLGRESGAKAEPAKAVLAECGDERRELLRVGRDLSLVGAGSPVQL